MKSHLSTSCWFGDDVTVYDVTDDPRRVAFSYIWTILSLQDAEIWAVTSCESRSRLASTGSLAILSLFGCPWHNLTAITMHSSKSTTWQLVHHCIWAAGSWLCNEMTMPHAITKDLLVCLVTADKLFLNQWLRNKHYSICTHIHGNGYLYVAVIPPKPEPLRNWQCLVVTLLTGAELSHVT